MYQLKQNIKELIAADPILQGKLASQADKSVFTIQKWIREDDQKITMLSMLNVIREHCNLDKKVLLTEEMKLA